MKKITLLFFNFLFVTHSITYTISMLNLVKDILPENPIVLEAGAHIGEDTIKMSSLWPHGTIYAFEPLASSVATINRRIEGIKNIIFFPIALNNFTGYVNLYFCPTNAGASSLNTPNAKFQADWPYEERAFRVECITLDDWTIRNNIQKIDLMWLDMEGSELRVLKSIKSKILDTVSAIVIEVNFKPYWIEGSSYDEVASWMEEHDFQLKYLLDLFCDSFIQKDQTTDFQGNAIFVRKSR